MNRKKRFGWLGLTCALISVGMAQAQAPVERVIHSFGYFPRGEAPNGPLTADGSGNLYGTTRAGGAGNLGAVFKLSASGEETVLYGFKGGTDGEYPWAGVTFDSAGNLYGTTNQGGPGGRGVVYKLDPSGNETILYGFTGGADGGNPYAGVIVDSAGNLYGTTYAGGSTACGPAGCGVVYKVSPTGQETVLHAFTSSPADGANPYGGVVADADGNLYGTTQSGGTRGLGIIFKLSPEGQETILYNFGVVTGSPGGPKAGVILDSAGNLYGTVASQVYELQLNGTYTVLASFAGYHTLGWPTTVTRDAAGNLYGTTVCPTNIGEVDCQPKYGVVFKLGSSGGVTTLYSFTGGADGSNPYGGVILDSSGDLYGTATTGGVVGAGTLYKVSASGQETTLHKFRPAAGGTTPYAGVRLDAAGNLYGTTRFGGAANDGVLFKLAPSGEETVLHTFTGGADGEFPIGNLAFDAAGNLYGVTSDGGADGYGTVYKVDPSGQETVLFSFGGIDGEGPEGVVLDAAGNLYGSAAGGGPANAGVVFKIDPAGQETVLYAFTGLSDGDDPLSSVVLDAAGNIYGTTYFGGLGEGVVYKVDPAGQETVLYTFPGGVDGGNPQAGVIRDEAGNLYGTATYSLPNGGCIYKLDPSGQYTVLYSFAGLSGGYDPYSGVVRDLAGNLYGTTPYGGPAGALGLGTVYRLDTSGNLTVLHAFTGGADGATPYAGVTFGGAGKLYGTTTTANPGAGGVVYEISLP